MSTSPGIRNFPVRSMNPCPRDVEAGRALDRGDPIASDEDSHVGLNRAPSHVDHRHVIQHGFPWCCVLSSEQHRDCRDQAQRNESGEQCNHAVRVTRSSASTSTSSVTRAPRFFRTSLSEICMQISDDTHRRRPLSAAMFVCTQRVQASNASGRGHQPVANSVPDTQPNPPRSSKFLHGNELPVPLRASPSDP